MRCFEIVKHERDTKLFVKLNNNMRCFEIVDLPREKRVEMLNNNMRCFEIRSFAVLACPDSS